MQKFKIDPQKIASTRSFIDQNDWKKTNFRTGSKGWKKFEPNNKTIALNVLFFYATLVIE